MEIQVKARHQYLAAMMPAAMLLTPAALLPETGWSQQLEEVTVTARRREENLQEIPVSVAAFDADDDD